MPMLEDILLPKLRLHMKNTLLVLACFSIKLVLCKKPISLAFCGDLPKRLVPCLRTRSVFKNLYGEILYQLQLLNIPILQRYFNVRTMS